MNRKEFIAIVTKLVGHGQEEPGLGLLDGPKRSAALQRIDGHAVLNQQI